MAKRASTPGSPADRPPRFLGWNTSDEEEIQRRRWRGQADITTVTPEDVHAPPFGAYQVRSDSGGCYTVEIRHLGDHRNSCGCWDFATNGLGTCKHIEGVLYRLARRAAGEGALSPCVEIHADTEGPCIQWPDPCSGPISALRSKIELVFEALRRGDFSKAASLRELAAAHPESLRLSSTLERWIVRQQQAQDKRARRHRFDADVAAGRTNPDVVKLPLLPYQKEGVEHLAFGERALLADEMGLGKTVQAIAACALLNQRDGIGRVLVVSPASLKAEWAEQIAHFTDLPSAIVAGPRHRRLQQYETPSFFTLTNYEQILNDVADINRVLDPDVVILDEAQRIKNWQTKTAQAVKSLRSRYAFVLTGTPLENKIDEIYSIVQFLDPLLLGPLFRFNRTYFQFDDRGRPADYQNLERLHETLAPVMLRRRKDQVEDQLPDRTVKTYMVPMTEEQQARYEQYKGPVSRLLHAAQRRPLSPEELQRLQKFLACMRMVCDSPYILDQTCRDAPKLDELETILVELLEEDPQRKILVFSEWVRMLELMRDLARNLELDVAWHTGSVPQEKRRIEIERFKQDPGCQLFLSSDAGSVGLNLQVADTVINLDLPWNPARLEQRIARAWRKNQTRSVTVVNMVSEESIEHRILYLLDQKQDLADGVLDGRGDLDALKMPSGRAAFLERLQTMMGPEARPSVPPPDPFDAVKTILAKELGGSFHRMEIRRTADGKEVGLVVVEGDPDTVRARLEAGSADMPDLEVITAATAAELQRLEQLGLIQRPGGQPARVLYQKPAPDREAVARRRAQIVELAGQADHQIRMAQLLAGGGFAAEATTPVGMARGLVIRALMVACGRDDPGEALDQDMLTDALMTAEDSINGFFPEASRRMALINAEDEPLDGRITEVQNLLQKVRSAFVGA